MSHLFSIAACVVAMSPSFGQQGGCGVTHKNSEPYFQTLRNNIARLQQAHYMANGVYPIRATNIPAVRYSWPLQAKDHSNFTYFFITNYVDLDTTTEVLDANGNYVSGRLDYNCGLRTYDGHNGLDIALLPYAWRMQNEEAVAVVAAADGIIVGGDDGWADNNCSWGNVNGNAWGNWLAIMHDDSTVTTYCHMKFGSVIPRCWAVAYGRVTF